MPGGGPPQLPPLPWKYAGLGTGWLGVGAGGTGVLGGAGGAASVAAIVGGCTRFGPPGKVASWLRRRMLSAWSWSGALRASWAASARSPALA
uniref:hypothetical protein n=1 Tax=Mycobacterium tilburgii TaxID=44467 RepID=UPI0038994BE3